MSITFKDIKESGGSLVVLLEGRIDSGNAHEIEDTLLAFASKHPSTPIELDFSRLEYVSSAGLRIIVRLLKRHAAGVRITNANREVYDVLETTGISTLLSVSRRPRELSLEGIPQIGAGAFGRVFRLDAERVAKIYDPNVNPLASIERERQGARQAFTHGIPSAIPFETVRAGSEFGIIYELVDAQNIGEVVSAHPEQAREYGRRMARLAQQLHSTRFDEGSLPDARLIFHGWIDRAEKSALYASATIAKLREFVDGIPKGDTFVHGDFHPANIMVMPDGELTLIDMGDASMGDPVIDLAGMFHVVRVAARRPGGAKRLTGMSAELLDSLWDAFLHAYYNLDDDAQTAEIESRLRLYAMPRTMGSTARSKLIDEETRKRQAKELEQAFICAFAK